jgi:hypothetical protein
MALRSRVALKRCRAMHKTTRCLVTKARSALQRSTFARSARTRRAVSAPSRRKCETRSSGTSGDDHRPIVAPVAPPRPARRTHGFAMNIPQPRRAVTRRHQVSRRQRVYGLIANASAGGAEAFSRHDGGGWRHSGVPNGCRGLYRAPLPRRLRRSSCHNATSVTKHPAHAPLYRNGARDRRPCGRCGCFV